MKISELQPRQGKVDIEVEVVSMGEIREFSKFGKSGRVCNATVKDDSGEIQLTLWNDDIDTVKPGLKLKIENGYVNEWQGEKQLTTGKFGKLEVVGGESSSSGPTTAKPKAEPEEAEEDPEMPVEEELIE